MAQAFECPDEFERASWDALGPVLERAACVVLASDAGSPSLDHVEIGVPAEAAVLHLGLRKDLGAAEGAEISVCAPSGEGMDDLRAALGEAVLPAASRSWAGPWAFDARLLG